MAKISMRVLGIWILSVFPTVRSEESTLYWSVVQDGETRLYRLQGDPDIYVPQFTNNSASINARYTSFNSSLVKFGSLGSDYYQPTPIVYCQDKLSGDLFRLYPNTNNANKFYRGLSSLVKDIAVDWISKNVYFTDPLLGIGLVSYAAEWYTIIQQRPGISNLYGIDVDPLDGYLFYADSDEGVIYRSALTGHNETRIVTNSPKPTLLVADVQTKSLYWIDVQSEVLFTSDYHGDNLRSIWSSYEITTDFFSAMAIYNNYVFLSKTTGGSIDVRNKMNGDFISPLSPASVQSGRSYGLAIVSPLTQPFPQDSTMTGGCPTANGGCSHICVSGGLLAPSQCLCQFGYQLHPDGRSCQAQPLLDNFLLFTDASGEAIYQMDPLSGEVRIVPTASLSNAAPQGVTYDPVDQYVYWTEVNLNLIRRKRLTTDVEQTFFSQSQTSATQALTVDVTGRGLYYTDAGLKLIGRLDLDTKQHSIILRVSASEKPFQIQLDPYEGYMYWSDWGSKKIERANMTDGSNRQILVSSGLQIPTGLAVDVIERQLYWSDSATRKVEVANLDGTNRRLLVELPGECHGLTIDQYFIYVNMDRVILQIRKADASIEWLGPQYFWSLFGIHYYSSTRPDPEWSPTRPSTTTTSPSTTTPSTPTLSPSRTTPSPTETATRVTNDPSKDDAAGSTGLNGTTLLAIGLVVAGVVVIAVIVAVTVVMVTRKSNKKKYEESKTVKYDPSKDDAYLTTTASPFTGDSGHYSGSGRYGSGYYEEIPDVVPTAATNSQIPRHYQPVTPKRPEYITLVSETQPKVMDNGTVTVPKVIDQGPNTVPKVIDQGPNMVPRSETIDNYYVSSHHTPPSHQPAVPISGYLTMDNHQGRNIEDQYLTTTNDQSRNIEDQYLTTANDQSRNIEDQYLTTAKSQGSNIEDQYLTTANSQGNKH